MTLWKNNPQSSAYLKKDKKLWVFFVVAVALLFVWFLFLLIFLNDAK